MEGGSRGRQRSSSSSPLFFHQSTTIFKLCFIVILLQSLPLLSHSILDPIDFLALQSIRKSLSDTPGSTFFKSWDFTSDPCTFPGVYCDADKVTALNLGDPTAGTTGLDGRLDPAIGKLTALTEFTVVPGRVMGKIPETVSQLTNLRFFAVSRNYLTGPIPAGFGELQSLRTLDLSYNHLSGPMPHPIASLPYLSNLILAHNHLTGSIPSFPSTSLTRLDLTHNNLSGSLSPNTFSTSSTLEYLSLSSNHLTGPVDQLLTHLLPNNLRYLDLSTNQFVGLIPPDVLQSTSITKLQLQRNSFSGPVRPGSPVTIATVDLSYNRLSGEVSPYLSTVQNLYLNNNRFTGKLPGGFVDRIMDSTIQTLFLQHNYLTGLEMADPTTEIPVSSALCLQYNCMVPPPVQTTCPLKAGSQITRPTEQCVEWRG